MSVRIQGSNSNTQGSSPTGQTHTVRRGDTLSAIAQQNGVKLSDLIAANPQIRNPDLIFPGQQISIPQQSQAAQTQGPQANQPPAQPTTPQAPAGTPGNDAYTGAGRNPPTATDRPTGQAPANLPPADPQAQQQFNAQLAQARTQSAPPAPRREPETNYGKGWVRTEENKLNGAQHKDYNGSQGGDPPNSISLNGRGATYSRTRVGDQVTTSNGRTNNGGGLRENTTTTNTRSNSGTRSSTTTTVADRSGNSLQETNTTATYNGRGTVRSNTNTEVSNQNGQSTTTTTRNSNVTTNNTSRDRTTTEASSAPTRNAAQQAWDNREVNAGVTFVEGNYQARAAGTTLGADPRDLRNTGAGLDVSVGRFEAKGGVGATANLRTGQVNVGASGAVQADAINIAGRAQVGNSESRTGALVAQGEARVGANAAGGAGVQIDPRRGTAVVRAGVEGFAGAEATGRVGYESRYGGVAVEGKAQAGIGGAANATLGIENGRVRASVDLGACVGLGGRVKIDVNVNVRAIAEDGWAAARSVGGRVAGWLGF